MCITGVGVTEMIFCFLCNRPRNRLSDIPSYGYAKKWTANQVKQTGGTSNQLEPGISSFRRLSKPQVHVYI